MITNANAEKQLTTKIGERTNDVKHVWSVFKTFANEKVIGEEEKAILFQCGVYNYTGEKLFYFDFVRQFSVEDGSIQQLHCEFVFTPNKQLKKLEASEWFFESEGNLEEFFDDIENLDEFKIPISHTPLKLNIYQEEA
ncbi:hypothetical protein [Peribacillus deserti]|uniref:Uncharacterized protein n=1 Tax=Peribacillus deserti TaxID=673318 RepID=A0A2N5LZP1_9BACI|nr:hypothetical protein [Peribacillus deserti]PLT27561.1 hypothetical protein CUU66_23225 [Peribacillus deserti]